MLDVELMKKLHEFGGLTCYRASYFNPTTWTVVHEPATFNEEVAKAQVTARKEQGLTAGYTMELVKFDGKFNL